MHEKKAAFIIKTVKMNISIPVQPAGSSTPAYLSGTASAKAGSLKHGNLGSTTSKQTPGSTLGGGGGGNKVVMVHNLLKSGGKGVAPIENPGIMQANIAAGNYNISGAGVHAFNE